MSYLPITGTFLDEVTHDIPSQNWGPAEWAREFDTFVQTGIDTVIIIRSGYGEKLSAPSKAISSRRPTLPVYIDLVRLFLDLAAERGIKLFFGLYDSGYHWYRNDWTVEVDINKAYLHEMFENYGDSPAFQGWYLPHETSDSGLRIIDINTALAKEIKSISDLPILASPYFHARSDYAVDTRTVPRTPEEHARAWSEIFERYAGLVDYCAFQDGTADLLALEDITAATAQEARNHGIRLWSNLETFDRDMPIKFPPTDWRKLAHKLDVVQPYVDKVITFEFSHFMSPNSMWEPARNLYRRYREFLESK
ncbi:DUF4434 domain-containing protein [Nonomuraea sp. NPDC005983]|uniref:DUF4434 domain-containing protein n=1 Tax=Nonomuraea sp. NPDC005983 TaxID=3155595 RepID=UPI0033ACD84E